MPSPLVGIEPFSNCSISARDLEDELQNRLHPFKEAKVALNGLQKSSQPDSPATGKVLSFGLEEELKEAQERSDAVIIVLIKTSFYSSEKLFDLLSVMVGVMAVSSGNSPRRAVSLGLNYEPLQESGLRNEDVCLLRGDKGSQSSIEVSIELVWRGCSCSSTDSDVTDTGADKLHKVFVLWSRTSQKLLSTLFLYHLEVGPHFLVHHRGETKLWLLCRDNGAKVTDVTKKTSIWACTIKEEVHAATNDPSSQHQGSSFRTKRGKTSEDLEVVRQVLDEGLEVIQMREQHQNEITQSSHTCPSCLAWICSPLLLGVRPEVGQGALLLIVDSKHCAVDEATGQLGHLNTLGLEQHLFDNLPV